MLCDPGAEKNACKNDCVFNNQYRGGYCHYERAAIDLSDYSDLVLRYTGSKLGGRRFNHVFEPKSIKYCVCTL